MDELAERAGTCTRCELSLTRQRVVMGSGSYDARLVLVGEAPGRSEDEGGEPFIGRSGQLLFRLLREETGLARESCFVTNVVKCRPPHNRTPRREEIAACAPWWLEQLGRFRDPVIVTLGNSATRAVLGISDPIGAVHGTSFSRHGATVLATYHPAAALRGGSNVEAMLRADLRVVASILQGASQ